MSQIKLFPPTDIMALGVKCRVPVLETHVQVNGSHFESTTNLLFQPIHENQNDKYALNMYLQLNGENDYRKCPEHGLIMRANEVQVVSWLHCKGYGKIVLLGQAKGVDG